MWIIKKILLIVLLFFAFGSVVEAKDNNEVKLLFYKNDIQALEKPTIETHNKVNLKNYIENVELLNVETDIFTILNNTSSSNIDNMALSFNFFDNAKNKIDVTPSVLILPELNQGVSLYPISINHSFKDMSNNINTNSIDVVKLYDPNDSYDLDFDENIVNSQIDQTKIDYETCIQFKLKNQLNKSGITFLTVSFYDTSLKHLKTFLLEIPIKAKETLEFPIKINDFNKEIVNNAKYYNVEVLNVNKYNILYVK